MTRHLDDCVASALLLIANRVDPALLGEYEEWHRVEHVPERLTMPGFQRARRFAAGNGAERNFVTLYELDGLKALETSAYLNLLANPTPASARMRPALRDTRRRAFKILSRADRARGDRLAMLDAASLEDCGGMVEPLIVIGCTSSTLARSVEIRPHPAFGSAEPDRCAGAILFVETQGSDREATIESALRRKLDWHMLISEHSASGASLKHP